MRLRERLPRVCRSGWQHGAPGEDRGAPDSRSAPRARARGANGVSSLKDRLREVIKPVTSGFPPPLRPKPNATASLDALGGEWREGSFVVERRMPSSSRCGRTAGGGLASRLEAAAHRTPP